MKVRFYRGPWDGKIRDVAPTLNEVIVYSAKSNIASWSAIPSVPMTIDNFLYRRTNHTHPDGSVYFEWNQPKGTRWKH